MNWATVMSELMRSSLLNAPLDWNKGVSPRYFKTWKISLFVIDSSEKWWFSKGAFCLLNGLPSIGHYFQTRNRTELSLHSNRLAWVCIQTISIYFDLELLYYWKHCNTPLTIPFLFSSLLLEQECSAWSWIEK